MIVSNSSPIIILGKQGSLELLRRCFKKIIIPESVYNEVLKDKNSPESIALEEAIIDKWIIVEKASVNPLLETLNLGQGEKEAISLAVKHKIMLIIDDDSAKAYAKILGVKAHGTLYVLYIAVLKKYIDKAGAKSILERMIRDGFYISTDIYSRFLELLNSL